MRSDTGAHCATSPTNKAGGGVPFERMKVAQLKEELAARGSTRTGLKMVLQRRLHGMLVHAARAHEMEE